MPFLLVMEVWKRLNREKENYKQGKSKVLSVVSLGKARWYWIIWPSTASGVQEAAITIHFWSYRQPMNKQYGDVAEGRR
jgi:hypothetical protein